MPRSSRHKSHKQSKHSSRYSKEHSDSDDDPKSKDRNSKEESTVRVSSSGEKRKLDSQLRDVKDLTDHVNGDGLDEYVALKRRKDRGDMAGTDRWNGGGNEHAESAVLAKEMKFESDKGTNSKVPTDSKGKSARRHDSFSDKKDGNLGLAIEKEEIKGKKVEAKRKSEKDLVQKEFQYKDSKDKETRSERDKNDQRFGEERQVKRGTEGTEWPLQDELRNPELERELEKRIRKRRDDSSEKEKYQDDTREIDDRRFSSRGERAKEGKYKDEKRKDGGYKDKYKEDVDRDKRYRDDKYSDERYLKDRISDKSDTKHLKHESTAAEIHRKKSRNQSSNHDGSPVPDDQSAKHKDDRGRRKSDDKEDHKYRSYDKQHFDVEKESDRSHKEEPVNDRERSHSRPVDADSSLTRNRRRHSPSSSSHVVKDQYRHSKQVESKHRDSTPEERGQRNVSSSREVSWSMQKLNQKDESRMIELISERRTSPLQLIDKSPLSASTDHRYMNRSSVRRSLDVEETKDSKDCYGNEAKGSQKDAPLVDDNLSVGSSPFNRGISRTFPPTEEDNGRGKSSNRYKRIGDSSMAGSGKMQGNAWNSVPNWPSPLTSGFIPFQHGPPPVGFHPAMQHFPAPPIFGVRPYHHIPEADRFSGHGTFGWRNSVDEPPVHGWDTITNNDAHMYGRLNFEQNRHMMNSRGWERGTDMWKGQNGPATQKEEHLVDEAEDEGRASGEHRRIDHKADSTEVSQLSDGMAKDSFDAPKTVSEKESDLSTRSKDDDDEDGMRFWQAYITKLDLSSDLIHPELYDQCSSLIDKQHGSTAEEDASSLFGSEEVIEARMKIAFNISSVSLATTTDDSIFQRALSLYNKQKEETGLIKFVNEEKMVEPNEIPSEGVDDSVARNSSDKTAHPFMVLPEEPDPILAEEKLEVDVASSQEIVDGKISSPSNNTTSLVANSPLEEQQELVNTMCGPLVVSDVPSEAVMPKSIESGSVNLSRIHHSPESTH